MWQTRHLGSCPLGTSPRFVTIRSDIVGHRSCQSVVSILSSPILTVIILFTSIFFLARLSREYSLTVLPCSWPCRRGSWHNSSTVRKEIQQIWSRATSGWWLRYITTFRLLFVVGYIIYSPGNEQHDDRRPSRSVRRRSPVDTPKAQRPSLPSRTSPEARAPPGLRCSLPRVV